MGDELQNLSFCIAQYNAVCEAIKVIYIGRTAYPVFYFSFILPKLYIILEPLVSCNGSIAESSEFIQVEHM